MSAISLRLPTELLDAVDKNAKNLHVSRTSYIRKALRVMNDKVRKKRKNEHLMKVSKRVRDESIKVNQEFSDIEYDPEA